MKATIEAMVELDTKYTVQPVTKLIQGWLAVFERINTVCEEHTLPVMEAKLGVVVVRWIVEMEALF